MHARATPRPLGNQGVNMEPSQKENPNTAEHFHRMANPFTVVKSMRGTPVVLNAS